MDRPLQSASFNSSQLVPRRNAAKSVISGKRRTTANAATSSTLRRKSERDATLRLSYLFLFGLVTVLCFWLYSFGVSSSANRPTGASLRKSPSAMTMTAMTLQPLRADVQKSDAHKSSVETAPPVLLTIPELCTVTTDVRGNLGPAAVMLGNGTDWLKDRWQAASDMGGTAIRGRHWVQLDFVKPVVVHSARLDWETAYSDHYQLLVATENGPGAAVNSTNNHDDAFWTTVFAAPSERIHVSKTGTSPGFTKVPMPLHVVHTFELEQPTVETKSVRLLILSSATGWGVSLWRIEIYGTLHR